MNDIQKAIDEFNKSWCVPFTATYSTTEQKKRKFNSELKSLLEQVAKRAFHEGGAFYYEDFEDYWENLNLTFNED